MVIGFSVERFAISEERRQCLIALGCFSLASFETTVLGIEREHVAAELLAT